MNEGVREGGKKVVVVKGRWEKGLGERWNRNLQEPAKLSGGPGGRRTAREEL